MGLFRRTAKRVLKRVMGAPQHVPAAPPTRPAPTRDVAPEPVEDPGADLSNIECGAQELKERLDAGESVTVLDVREPHETASGVIEGAVLIPLGQLPQRWEEVREANEVVCYCALGARSLHAASLLRANGVINATSMDGGVFGWQEIGGTLVPPG